MIDRPRPFTIVVALASLLVTVLASCADDANDGAYQARRAAVLADEQRATATTVAAAGPSDGTTDGDPTGTTPAAEPTGVVIPVIALDNSFRPEVVEIAVGDEVLWENRGLNEHDVLYVEGDDWGIEVEDFQPGDVYGHVFTEPGEYRYYCSIHGSTDVGMVGTVVVADRT